MNAIICGAAGLEPAIDREMVLMPYFNIATTPLKGAAADAVLPEDQGCWNSLLVPTSFQRDRDGRPVIGSVGAPRALGSSVHKVWARREIRNLCPDLPDVEFEVAWHVVIGLTTNRASRFWRSGNGNLWLQRAWHCTRHAVWPRSGRTHSWPPPCRGFAVRSRYIIPPVAATAACPVFRNGLADRPRKDGAVIGRRCDTFNCARSLCSEAPCDSFSLSVSHHRTGEHPFRACRAYGCLSSAGPGRKMSRATPKT